MTDIVYIMSERPRRARTSGVVGRYALLDADTLTVSTTSGPILLDASDYRIVMLMCGDDTDIVRRWGRVTAELAALGDDQVVPERMAARVSEAAADVLDALLDGEPAAHVVGPLRTAVATLITRSETGDHQ